MQAFLAAIANKLFNYLLTYGGQWLIDQIKKRTERGKREAAIDAEAEKAKAEVLKPSDPTLTPEQVAKEQEDAFKKLNDTMSRPN